MTTAAFYNHWNSQFADTLPIAHYFRATYPDIWFRIHSLPESKRYADTAYERSIILERQNTLISDILGNSSFYLITGQYTQSGEEPTTPFVLEDAAYLKLNFTELETIDLDALNLEYESGLYRLFVSVEQVWEHGSINDILLSIADDRSRAFILCVEHNCIIAPYDGGVDVFLENETLRDIYKRKYSDWLSEREDGL